MFVTSAGDGDFATGSGHGLVGVLDKIEESLSNLIGVEGEFGKVFLELKIDLDLTGNELGLEGLEGVANQVIDLGGLDHCAGRADGVEKFLQEGVEATDLGTGGGEVFEEWVALTGRELLDFSLKKLEMNSERVEGVPNLVGDAGGEKGESVELFGFEVFL